MWAMTTYPEKTVFDRDYAQETTRIEALHESGNIDKSMLEEKVAELEQAQQAESLAYSVAGRIGH